MEYIFLSVMVIAFVLLILFMRFAWSRARLTDGHVADRLQTIAERQTRAVDREPQRRRNRDQSELIYDYVIGQTGDTQQARAASAWAEDIQRRGGDVQIEHNGISWTDQNRGRGFRQFSRRS